jgi:hypothetical protein
MTCSGTRLTCYSMGGKPSLQYLRYPPQKGSVVAAERAGATMIATGHNLDDEAQSEACERPKGRLPVLSGIPWLIRKEGLSPIKPLSFISEKEIAAYLVLKNAWNELPECPHTRHALRREVRSILSDFNTNIPHLLHLMKVKRRLNVPCRLLFSCPFAPALPAEILEQGLVRFASFCGHWEDERSDIASIPEILCGCE